MRWRWVEVLQRFLARFALARRKRGARGGEQGVEFAVPELGHPFSAEPFPFAGIASVDQFGEGAQAFGGMMEVDDLNGPGELDAKAFPDPWGSIAQRDGCRLTGKAPAELGANHGAESATAFIGGHIGGGVQIPPGRVAGRGCSVKIAATFDLVRLGLSIGPLASASAQFLSQRRARAVVGRNARRGAGSALGRCAENLPRRRRPARQALELPGLHLQSGMRMEILAGIDEGLAGRRPTDQPTRAGV